MKKKRSKSKPAPECPNCALPSETKDQFCTSCAGIFQEIIEITLKRSIMIRYAPIYFYDAISLYRLWQIDSRRQRVLIRAKIIDKWFGENRHNKAEEEKFWKLHWMFAEFLASVFISDAEEKLEEMLKVLEDR